jgi:hypothetical protein
LDATREFHVSQHAGLGQEQIRRRVQAVQGSVVSIQLRARSFFAGKQSFLFRCCLGDAQLLGDLAGLPLAFRCFVRGFVQS